MALVHSVCVCPWLKCALVDWEGGINALVRDGCVARLKYSCDPTAASFERIQEDIQLSSLPLPLFQLVDTDGARDTCDVFIRHWRPVIEAFCAYSMPAV